MCSLLIIKPAQTYELKDLKDTCTLLFVSLNSQCTCIQYDKINIVGTIVIDLSILN